MKKSIKTIYINGRFLARKATGVDRFAHEVIRALDDILKQSADYCNKAAFVILVPPGTETGSLFFSSIEIKVVGLSRGIIWEQFDLPFHAKSGYLLNLCNAAPLFKLRQLVVIHDAAPVFVPESCSFSFSLWYRLLMPVIGNISDAVATVSNFSKGQIKKGYFIRSKTIEVISESGEHVLRQVADERILDRNNLLNSAYMLAVGSLSPHKGFGLFIEALELLAADFPVKIVVAGGINQSVFKGVDLPASIIHLGYVSDAELRALYENALCFIFPSYYEGFGLPVVEAMSLGCPVIAGDIAVLRENYGEDIVYFESGSHYDLADKINNFAESSDIRDVFSQRGISRAAEFKWRNSALKLLSILEDRNAF
jgi:glycosyltransferase involved in cell wall biosynthesis